MMTNKVYQEYILIINEQPNVVFLQETKLHQAEMERVRIKLRCTGMIAVDCMGDGRRRKGGIAILWKEGWDVTLGSLSANHIDVTILMEDGIKWRFTGVYGHPESDNKGKTGRLLCSLYNDEGLPWLCGGDFNLMLWSSEKQGGADFNFDEAGMFRQALDYCKLDDLHYVGYPFTWTNNQGGEANLQERLDRFVANAAWRNKYENSYVTHLEKRQSDHLPLMVSIRKKLGPNKVKQRRKVFRFEELWTREEECGDIIKEMWRQGADICSNLTRTARSLKEWSHKKFGEFAREIRECKAQMGTLMTEEQTHETIRKMRAIDERMDELEKREEIYWKQRSRQEWLRHGDRNTKFFHAKAKQRVARNHIKRLTNEVGEVFEEEDDIANLLTNHFQVLFKANDNVELHPVLDKVEAQLSSTMQDMLNESFRREEIEVALKQMHPTKAPGPDGMCALFYQKCWDTIGNDVCDQILAILNNNDDIENINHTHIVLIPKKKVCVSPTDFRPISLCNVVYKILSKVLANRLKRVLPSIIHESQSGFVPGRLITDNILVAYECFHYLKKKKTGKDGFLGLKLDMSKAYDRVEWQFLERMMSKMGFPRRYVQLIMGCVTSTSFSILVNGQPTERFVPSRGLRQGDPLSPFLFIICAEGLSSLLRDAEAKKEIHGLKIGKKVDAISHLFFADDSILFTRANEEEVEKVMEILNTYEAASGQKLNIEKSEVSFSQNIDQEKKNLLQMKLSFTAVDDHEKYLGVPTYVSGSKKKVFKYIQERVLKKLKGWKEGFLSQAGREVLIKAIAQAIPTYAMQCFAIPISILKEVESMYRAFFWGQRREERKISWIAWNKLMEPKTNGGLGMRDLPSFNKALLAKQAWRIIKFPNSLVARTLKNKYFPNSSFLDAKVSPISSFTWRSIASARDIVQAGLRKVVGNGNGVNIWEDPWVPKLPKFRIISTGSRTEEGPQRVSELMRNGEWNVALLNQYFSSWEIEAIRSIPIPINERQDTWAWHFTKNGTFSTRSAYHVAVKAKEMEAASTSGTNEKDIWAKLWSSNIPMKVKNFGWRALHNGVAVRANLKIRGCECDPICPLCGEEPETITHRLVTCAEARWVWKFSPLRLEVKPTMQCSFKE